MHRDIKPENIILKDRSDDFDIKLADFGLGCFVSNDIVFRRCGTPGYVAPEILDNQKYDEKVDIFSSGVIFYTL
jgi:calcium-dependent protein kinase